VVIASARDGRWRGAPWSKAIAIRAPVGSLAGAVLIGTLALIMLAALVGLVAIMPSHLSCETTTNHAPIPCG
jgi:hypothetical protein